MKRRRYRRNTGARTMSAIKAKNRAAGYHFFEKDTLRFFKSVVYPTVYGNGYFVTRETNPSGQTRYTIRKAEADGNIKTVGEFHRYRHLDDARDEAKRLSRSTLSNPRKYKSRNSRRYYKKGRK